MPMNNYERAAHYVHNAVYGRMPGDTTDAALLAQRIYHNTIYRVVYTSFTIMAMILAVWEPPVQVKSTSTLAIVRALDFIFLLVVAADVILQCVYHGPRTALGRGWMQAKILTWLALLINLIIVTALPAGSVPYIARVLRPLLCVERLRNVRKIAGNIARTGGKIINVGVLLMLHLLVFGVIGFVLYAGIDDGQCDSFRSTSVPMCSTFSDTSCRNYFASLGEAMMHLFELLTAANFPEVMMPVYRCNRANVLFFLAFVLIGLYLLLNLTLAVAYASFRDLMKEEVMLKYARMFAGCDAAFGEVATPARGEGAGRGVSLKRPDFITFFRALRPEVDPEAAGLLFDSMDGTGTGEVDKREFRRMVLNYSRIKIVKPMAQGGGGSNGSPSKKAKWAATWIARPGGSGSPGAGGATSTVAGPGAVSILPQVRSSANNNAGADEDSDDEEEEVEILEVALGEGEMGVEHGSTGAADEVVGGGGGAGIGADVGEAAGVVRNPLAGALGPGTPQQLTERASRVQMLQGGQASASVGGEGGDRGSAAGVPAWGSASPPSVSNIAAARALSRSVSSKYLGPPPGADLDFLDRFFLAAREAFYRGFSTSTTTDGYGLDPDSNEGRGGRGGRGLPRGITPGTLRARILNILRSALATAVFDATVLINSVTVLAQLSLETDEPGSIMAPALVHLRVVQYTMLGVFLAEVGLKVLVWGPREYWRESVFNRLDLALTIASLTGTILEGAGVLTRAESSAVAFLRFLRLVRAFRMLPGFGLTLASFGDVLPVLARYAALLLAALYAFAMIGMEAFGGQMTPKNPAVAQSSYGESDYYVLNFDTLQGAFVCLFYLLVVNDWPILMEGAVAGIGSKVARGYFIAFWAVTIVLVLNVVVAFLIEAFQAEKTKRETLVKMERERAAAMALAARAGSAAGAGQGGTVPYSGRDHGVDDWRALILHSPVAPRFRAYHVSKARHHLDIYDELYREDVRSAFPETFGAVRGARA